MPRRQAQDLRNPLREGPIPMPRPLNIIDLAITDEVSNDAAEVARRLDQAADLVEEFAADSALDALDALLAAASGPAALEKTRRLAAEVSQQSEILHSEVERFLAVSAGQRPN
jgi:ABC-type transporter Mla subunit MlaD